MAGDFAPDAVDDGLWVGPAPRTAEDFVLLRGVGVTDVVTLQTEDEARGTGLQPSVAFRLATVHGMVLHRRGIEDFSHRNLAAGLADAVGLVTRLRGAGKRVYVHCAAGLNRSPTVVAGVLAVGKGLSAEQAAETVRAAHPSNPDVKALKSAFGR